MDNEIQAVGQTANTIEAADVTEQQQALEPKQTGAEDSARSADDKDDVGHRKTDTGM